MHRFYFRVLKRTCKPIKIGFIGAPCSGKTTTYHTLISMIKSDNEGECEGVHENARFCPHPLNAGGTMETLVWVLTEQMRNECHMQNNFDILVCDRSIFDEIPFAQMNDQITSKQTETLWQYAKLWQEMYPYDAIFFFMPVTLVKDFQRNIDLAEQTKIQGYFEQLVECIRALNIKVYIVEGTRTQRAKYVYQKIMELRRQC